MPAKSKLKLRPLPLAKESVGERIARLRKERGFTQVELAAKIGIIQSLVSGYELDRIRPHPEMIVRFALVLGVTTDELLGLKKSPKDGYKPSLRLVRRMKKIEKLPPSRQKTVLATLDALVRGTQTS